MSNVPLPEPHHQSAANFNAPDEPFYTADQMHAHAAAVSAAKDAEIAQLRAELIKSLADNAALRAEVAGLRAWLEADARCPCCDTTDACVDGCTFANDCPQDAERMAEVRALLAARKGEA